MFPSRYIASLTGSERASRVANTYSVDFDGTNDYIDCGDNGDLDFGTGDFSVSIWHKSGAETDQPFLAKKRLFSNSSAGWVIYQQSSPDVMRCRIAGGSSNVAVSATTVADDGEWHLTVMVRSGDNLYLYFDGVREGTETGVNSLDVDNSETFKIGRSGSLYPAMIADEVAIWSKALTDTDISAIYDNVTLDLTKDSVGYAFSLYLKTWLRMGDGTLDDGNVAGNSLIGDEATPTLGSELFDSDAKALAVGGTYGGTNPVSSHGTDTYAWFQEGSNTLENDSGQIKITYADDGNGAKFYFRNASDLSAEMDAHSIYKFTFDARYTGGSSGVKGKVYDGVGYSYSSAFTNSGTSFTIYFQTFASPADNFFRLDSLASSNVVNIDNLSVKKVNGNPGVMINMTPGDIKADVPS